MYSIDFLGNIIRDLDGAIIPVDVNNIDYQDYIMWIDRGNTPLPYEPPIIDSKEQAKAELHESDSDMARIAEDLISALIGKGVIAESDIPQPARSKLARRAELRSKLA